MKKVYIVVGSTGEYSDYSEWNAKAFFDKERANALLDKLRHIIDETTGMAELEKKLRAIDKKAYVDYTGILYRIDELEVEG